MLTCHFKKYTGLDCPGCGAQRSLLLLSKGEVTESFLMFPALIPLLCTFVFLLIHLKFKLKHGAKVLIFSFALSAGIMVMNFIYKISIAS